LNEIASSLESVRIGVNTKDRETKDGLISTAHLILPTIMNPAPASFAVNVLPTKLSNDVHESMNIRFPPKSTFRAAFTFPGLPLVCAAILLSGCQTVSGKVGDATTLRPVDAAAEYQVQPGDILESHYGSNPSLNEQVLVMPDGKVSFLGARNLMAAGQTLPTLRTTVIDTAKIIDPSFDVVLRSSVGTRVYVTGEVATPGEIVANGPISAVQAVSRAGGLKLGAQSDRVVLVRHFPASQSQAYAVNLQAVMDGSNPAADVMLQPYDIIYVPRDRIGNVSLVFERLRNAVPIVFSLVYGDSNGKIF
jgi:polysaccharide export outer membrane protein